MLRNLLKLEKYDDLNEMLESLDEKILEDEEIKKIIKLSSNNQHGKNNGDIEGLVKLVQDNPENLDNRFNLAEFF